LYILRLVKFIFFGVKDAYSISFIINCSILVDTLVNIFELDKDMVTLSNTQATSLSCYLLKNMYVCSHIVYLLLLFMFMFVIM